jgi:hypothetical protein
LDLHVARALGDRLVRLLRADGDRIRADRCETRFGEQWDWSRFMPSGAWMDGGPIIEREGIGFLPCFAERGMPGQPYIGRFYKAFIGGRTSQFGKTHLEAAMRAFVASKYGVKGSPDAPREGRAQ